MKCKTYFVEVNAIKGTRITNELSITIFANSKSDALESAKVLTEDRATEYDSVEYKKPVITSEYSERSSISEFYLKNGKLVGY